MTSPRRSRTTALTRARGSIPGKRHAEVRDAVRREMGGGVVAEAVPGSTHRPWIVRPFDRLLGVGRSELEHRAAAPPGACECARRVRPPSPARPRRAVRGQAGRRRSRCCRRARGRSRRRGCRRRRTGAGRAGSASGSPARASRPAPPSGARRRAGRMARPSDRHCPRAARRAWRGSPRSRRSGRPAGRDRPARTGWSGCLEAQGIAAGRIALPRRARTDHPCRPCLPSGRRFRR